MSNIILYYEKTPYKLEIEHWSATDYSVLINNGLGWVSDDQKWYCFETEREMNKFKEKIK